MRSITSIAQFVDVVCGLRDDWAQIVDEHFDPWFRGHSDARWALTPNLFRRDLTIDEEDEIRSEFRRRGSQLVIEREPRDDWDWYFLMQHYGAPTRLLDWSNSALIALFFALNAPTTFGPDVVADAAVWMLDPFWLNQQSIRKDVLLLPEWPEARPFLPPVYEGSVSAALPVAVSPRHVARRLAVQHAQFTIHGTDPAGLANLARRSDGRLRKFTIARRAVRSMRKDLMTCGILDTVLFPDLEGLSRELTRYWTEEWFYIKPRDATVRRPASRRRARAASRNPKAS